MHRKLVILVASVCALTLFLVLGVGNPLATHDPFAVSDDNSELSRGKANEQHVEPKSAVITTSSTVYNFDADYVPAGEKSAEATGNDSLPTWSEEPSVMEALILAELEKADIGVNNIDPVKCTETECELRYTTPENCHWLPIIESSREPPISAARSTFGGRVVAGGRQCRITFYSFKPEIRSVDPGQFMVSADELRRRAAEALDPDDYTAAPVGFLGITTARGLATITAENVCTFDCALDGRQVIYLRFLEDVTCDEEVRGIEQHFMATTSNGGLEERTFCVPNTLVND
jgi:hypothetical protein